MELKRTLQIEINENEEKCEVNANQNSNDGAQKKIGNEINYKNTI